MPTNRSVDLEIAEMLEFYQAAAARSDSLGNRAKADSATLGFGQDMRWYRFARGWTVEKALTMSIMRQYRHSSENADAQAELTSARVTSSIAAEPSS
jgi:hypothetical protein